MKTFPRSKRTRGFALLLVLIIVSFATLISLLYLLSAGQERSGTSAYAEGSAVRQLASQAVSLVIGQINAATHEGTMSNPVSWASQPGMIRTYNAQGKLSNAYKLYSWSNLTESSQTFSPSAASEMPAANWSSEPAQYTDLNQPVNSVYPIVDPNVLDTANSASTFSDNNPNGIKWDFPGEAGLITGAVGYYPSGSNPAPMPVQWLYILQDGTWSTPATINGNTATIPNASAANPIVGRIAFWTDDETAKVNINTASEGSCWDTPKAGTADELQFAGNPPLQNEFQRLSGHPATTSLSAVFPELLGGASGFSRWTSSGGVNSVYLTALQAILGYGTAGSATSHGLNPRTFWGSSASSGGSQGGTFPINSYLATYEPLTSTYFPGGYVAPSTYSPTPNTDRLYATSDDVFFQPSPRNQASAFATSNITARSLSQRLFFITANSIAPETTLYETPRVSLWPITWPYASSSYWHDLIERGTNVGTLTPSPANLSSNPFMAYQEKLLAFCSSLNAGNSTSSSIYPYYFQRQDPDSPTWDWSNIARNQNLASYLANELSDPLSSSTYPSAPGIGASLGAKWDADKPGTTDWITLNCFDYIRSMVNQYTLDPNSSTGKLLYSFTSASLGTSSLYQEANSFTSVPLNVSFNGNKYTTEGSYPALREAALVFYATKRNIPKFVAPGTSPPGSCLLKDVVNPDNWTNLISWNGTTGNSQTTQMRMVMLLNFSQLNPGISSSNGTGNSYKPVFWIKVTRSSGASSFQVNSSSINFPLSGGNVVEFNPQVTTPFVVAPGYAAALFSSATAAKTFSDASSAGSSTVWSLMSDPININPLTNPNSFTFAGSKVQIDIYSIPSAGEANSGSLTADPTSNTTNLVSSYTFDFSKWNNTSAFTKNGLATGQFPLPIAPYWNVRQSPMLVSTPPSGSSSLVTTTQEASPPPTMTVTGGVLMPYFLNASVKFPNWQSEIVPLIGQMDGLTTSAGAIAQWGTTRTGGSKSLDPTDAGNTTANPEPLMYAFQDSAGVYTSTIFDDRVAQLPQPTANTTLVGQTLDNPSYTGVTSMGTSHLLFAGSQNDMGLEGYQVITPYDTAISLVVDPTADKTAGDPRLIGRGINGGSVTFSPITQVVANYDNYTANPLSPISTLPNFGQAGFLLTAGAQLHEMGSPNPYTQITGIRLPWLFSTTPMTGSPFMATRGGATQVSSTPSAALSGPPSLLSNTFLLGFNDMQAGLSVESNVLMSINPNWDWTRLPGSFSDGGYLLRPPEEYQGVFPYNFRTSVLDVPFFEGLDPVSGGTNISAGYFSPSRQVASPVILGTLPDSQITGWQTLNFCPNPAITMNSGTAHPGMGSANSPSATGAAYTSAPDHLLLDLFWMPVAEPYPISEEFATAGKVNLNYAMMPFPYLQRKTALDALLKSVWITAMPSPSVSPNFAAYYKSYGMLYQTSRLDLVHTRYPINVDATLRAFDYKFQQGDIFRSASQICDMFLYPNDPNTPNTLWAGDANTKGIAGADSPPSTSNIGAWWVANSFTADNEREAPYNAVYSRVTTKSNTYTVHWRAQTLQVAAAHANQWIEGSDHVTSELRGSTLIDRYIDPNATLPDYATNTPAKAGGIVQPMSYYYKWRVDSENYFQPSP